MSALIERGGEVRLGSSDLISPGEGRSIRVDGQAIALFRGRTGDLYAVENRCPHRGGPLADGIFGGGQVICPYHSYRFDLATGACLTDATCSLRTFPVSERHGEILVTILNLAPPLAASYPAIRVRIRSTASSVAARPPKAVRRK